MLRTRVQGRDPFVLSSLRFCDFPHFFFQILMPTPSFTKKSSETHFDTQGCCIWDLINHFIISVAIDMLDQLGDSRPDVCKAITSCHYFKRLLLRAQNSSSAFSRPLVGAVHWWLPQSSCLVHPLRRRKMLHCVMNKLHSCSPLREKENEGCKNVACSLHIAQIYLSCTIHLISGRYELLFISLKSAWIGGELYFHLGMRWGSTILRLIELEQMLLYAVHDTTLGRWTAGKVCFSCDDTQL